MESKPQEENKKWKKPWEKKGEFIADVFGNLLALWIVNNAPLWWPEFFSSSYPAVLVVFNLVITAQLFIALFLLVYSPKWIYYLGRAISNLFGFVSIVTVVIIFPLNVPYGLEGLVRLGLGISALITFIAALVYLAKATVGVISLKQD